MLVTFLNYLLTKEILEFNSKIYPMNKIEHSILALNIISNIPK